MNIKTVWRRIFKKSWSMGLGNSVRSWFGPIFEPFTGAWQRNIQYDSKESLLRNSAVYACVTGIASDVAKMRIKLCRNENGIWTEITENQPWLPVLRKPNNYQTRIRFIEQWILSKLLYGNVYIAKDRDARGIVNALYVLDPRLVFPVILPDGSIYYTMSPDPLAGITEASAVMPASEIIHDMMPALWHPLVGVPPLYACAISGSLGNKIQKQSMAFFDNQAMPGGVIEIPGDLAEDKLKLLKEKIESGYSGENQGKVMVLINGMKFSATQTNAQHAQLAEQLKLTVEDISRAFHYPLFKLGGPVPTLAGNVEALITTYYTDCLQTLIESLELCLDEGLALPAGMGTELDLDNLLRMDTAALYEANNKAVGGGWMAPDEARFKANYRPVIGGSTPYLQQQNYSLAALAKRDAGEDPFNSAKPPASPSAPPKEMDLSPQEKEMLFEAEWRKELTA